jgi:hypothetical protein
MFQLPSLLENIALYQAAADALGVKELDVCSRVQNEGARVPGDTCVLKLWYSEIKPPTASPACLAHVLLASAKNRAEVRGARTVMCIPDGQLVLVQGPVDREPGWSDPVADAVARLDIWSGGGEIPFGGFSYRVVVCTTHVRSAMRFARAVHPSRRAIASAMFEVATSLGSCRHPVLSTFLDLWSRELHSLDSQ